MKWFTAALLKKNRYSDLIEHLYNEIAIAQFSLFRLELTNIIDYNILLYYQSAKLLVMKDLLVSNWPLDKPIKELKPAFLSKTASISLNWALAIPCYKFIII